MCTVLHLPHLRAASAVVDGLKYQSSHEWVKEGGDSVTVGVSDFAQVSAVSAVSVGYCAAGTDAPALCGNPLRVTSFIKQAQKF